jgi:hypothetical protein
MNDKQRGEMINDIIGVARSSAIANSRHFDGADLFFSLAFMDDATLLNIYNKVVK